MASTSNFQAPPVVKNNIAARIREFRLRKGLTQQEFGGLLGVGKITVLRWENGTSRPSPLAAKTLQEIGFGPLTPEETKQVSKPRLTLQLEQQLLNNRQTRSHGTELRDGVRGTLRIGNSEHHFDPSPYVVNGPSDQLDFFETLYRLQEPERLSYQKEKFAKRLSCVSAVDGLGVETAQHALERPKATAVHWNPNYGLHGAHRYVGRFPPHLVRALLNHFSTKKGDVVCDPFAGSGTTLLEARLLGLRAIGIEICPLSCLIARTKSQFPTTTSHIEKLIEDLTVFYQDRWPTFVGARDVRDISHQEIIARRGNSLPAFTNLEKWLTPEALLGTSLVIEFVQEVSGYEKDLLCCALSSRMRSIGNVDVDVIRAEYSKTPRENVDVLGHVQRAVRKLILGIHDSLRTHKDLVSERKDIKVVQRSLLSARIDSASLDAVITSPPYGVESLSYLRTHLLSYRCLHPILKHDPYSLDNNCIGSEYGHRASESSPSWSPGEASKTFKRFFKKVLAGAPEKKALQRAHMMMQFFVDMERVAARFHDWLKPNGRIAFVIGNKRLGESLIPTDVIIGELFEARGLKQDSVIRHKLKCNNSNSEVPWQERTIQEEFVLLFTRRP